MVLQTTALATWLRRPDERSLREHTLTIQEALLYHFCKNSQDQDINFHPGQGAPLLRYNRHKNAAGVKHQPILSHWLVYPKRPRLSNFEAQSRGLTIMIHSSIG